MSRPLIAFTLTVLLVACGKDDTGPAPQLAVECEPACAAKMHCEEGACVCDEGFVDCDNNPANGCEPLATCGCLYEGDEAFCAKFSATCGDRAGYDNCNNWRITNCGSCPSGQACGAHEPNTCGDGECTAQTGEAVCRDLEWMCGKAPATDRCGNQLDIDCGTCAQGLMCNRRHECVLGGAGAYEPCLEPGDCRSPYECVEFSETEHYCVATCERSSDCPNLQQCALPAGEREGLCGNWRKLGESCEFQWEGENFCWDDVSVSPLLCMKRTCKYVCTMENEWADEACPEGMACTSEFEYSDEYRAIVRYCEPS